eukprot:764931-Hanusia_phi.AAC.7
MREEEGRGQTFQNLCIVGQGEMKQMVSPFVDSSLRDSRSSCALNIHSPLSLRDRRRYLSRLGPLLRISASSGQRHGEVGHIVMAARPPGPGSRSEDLLAGREGREVEGERG